MQTFDWLGYVSTLFHLTSDNITNITFKKSFIMESDSHNMFDHDNRATFVSNIDFVGEFKIICLIMTY